MRSLKTGDALINFHGVVFPLSRFVALQKGRMELRLYLEGYPTPVSVRPGTGSYATVDAAYHALMEQLTETARTVFGAGA